MLAGKDSYCLGHKPRIEHKPQNVWLHLTFHSTQTFALVPFSFLHPCERHFECWWPPQNTSAQCWKNIRLLVVLAPKSCWKSKSASVHGGSWCPESSLSSWISSARQSSQGYSSPCGFVHLSYYTFPFQSTFHEYVWTQAFSLSYKEILNFFKIFYYSKTVLIFTSCKS